MNVSEIFDHEKVMYWKIFVLILALYNLYLMLSLYDLAEERQRVFVANWKISQCWSYNQPLLFNNSDNITIKIVNMSDINVSIGRLPFE